MEPDKLSRAPANAAGSLHNHVSRLRKSLGPDILATQAWGYVLRVDPERIDRHRFERLVRDARPLPARERSAKLAEALALWRGPALADLVYEPALAKEVARLDELRLTVLEARIDADLELGRNSEIVGELEALIAKLPLREHLRWQLILALYRADRQAEALEVYRETRRLLADELGLEPSPALRDLEKAILRHDPSLAALAPVASRALPDEVQRRPRRRWLLTGVVGTLTLASGAAAAVALVRSNHHEHIAATPATQTLLVITEPTQTVTTTTKHHTRPAIPPKPRQTTSQTATITVAQPAPPPASTTTPKTPSHKPPTEPRTTPPKPPAKTTTTTRTTTTPKPPPSPLVTIGDDFSSDTINRQLWFPSSDGTGVDVAQRNGRLEITMHADATPDPVYHSMIGDYATSCSFSGDFDASIDYTLLDWPPANGTQTGFLMAFGDGHLGIVRFTTPEGDAYSSGMYANADASGATFRQMLTTDTSGGFRLTRVGSLITVYTRSTEAWVKFASTHRAGPVQLQPYLWASDAAFARKDVTVAFDNFALTFPQSSSPCAAP